MSVPTEPRPTEPLMFTNDEVWRRFPFNKTNTWSGPKPRKEAGSIWSVPSVTVCRFELNEGATKFKICPTSTCPKDFNSLVEITSTGVAV